MASVTRKVISTKIPARLDRLPWSKWHWYVVASLGTVWILDGLEVTMKGAVGPSLRDSLGMTSGQVGLVASIYVFGAISGALFWGYLTDRMGRKKLFLATLGVYMLGVIMTTLAWGFWSFAIFRFVTGFGIGGEYAAINSAIDELIPARARGWADLAINGSYWGGAAIAGGLSLVFLNLLPDAYGWRAAFATGGVLAVGILLLRRSVPESPRWLMTHGREEEAEAVVQEIEDAVRQDEGDDLTLEEPPDDEAIELRERRSLGFLELGRTMFRLYPKRSVVSFSLMATQAFLYNAIFFTYGLILTTFYGVSTKSVGLYIIPFAIGNLLGPILLGRFFDTVGRKPLISGCYFTAGILTAGIGYLFTQDVLSTMTLTAGWVVIFFFASAGASAGYLTVSETFPLEIRAMAIAFFYAIATGAGGIVGPWLFGTLIGEGNSRGSVYIGYLIGAGLMMLGGVAELLWGVKAEQRSLEDIAKPLSAADAGDSGDADASSARRTGPLGIDPADADDVRSFQEDQGLTVDGAIGDQTRGALKAERAAADDLDDDELELIDPTDPDDIRRFQRRFGLTVDAVIGPVTRGALRYARRVADVDPADTDEVRRFQHERGLPVTGVMDDDTRTAVRAVEAELAGDDELPDDVDPRSSSSVEAFQAALGLEDDGVVGPATRGALLAMRAHRRRSPIASDRSAAEDGRPAGALPYLDPVDTEAVRAFQRRYDLDETGDIDAPTAQALRYEADHHLGVDPSDPTSIRRFQREHGLEVDGILGPETQGAMAAVRNEREATDDDEREARYGPLAENDGAGAVSIDPADAASIEEFQREHGLEPDGVIGHRTQVALRAVGAGSRRDGLRRRHRHPYPRRSMRAGLMSSARIPSVDVDIDGEIEQIVNALDAGPLTSDELHDHVAGRRWGPGRFKRALRTALDEGRIERTDDDRYVSARVRA